MVRSAYLTIDDSPTRHTDELTDWLQRKNVPAVLFCIGSSYQDLDLLCEGMEQNPTPIQRAIGKGFVVGNHTWSHRRSSELTFEEVVIEIERTEKLIDKLYRAAGVARPAKLIRFPHLDRGAGGWIVDYNKLGNHKEAVQSLFGDGLNISLQAPSQSLIDKKHRIQEYLKREGFVADVYPGVSFDWFANTEMSVAYDHLYTFSTSDWMMNPDFAEHNHKWTYHSLEELKGKIDADIYLSDKSSANIVLAHDHNNMLEVTTALIEHMLGRGHNFEMIKT